LESSPHELFEYSLALTDVRLSPGGDKLSSELAQLFACLLRMPDPKLQSPTDFEIEKFLREYGNPRGMPEGWIRGHLTKSKPQLAIDVIRAFDKDFDLERRLRRTKLVLGVLNGFLALVATILALIHFQ
jgi:hypothetical protein